MSLTFTKLCESILLGYVGMSLLILPPERWRQEDYESEVSLNYLLRPGLKNEFPLVSTKEVF